MMSVSIGFILNTSLIPSINSHYPFIDKHCDMALYITSIGWHLIRYTTWIFYVSRIKYYFANSKLFNLSSFSYYTNILIYTAYTILSLYLQLTYFTQNEIMCIPYYPDIKSEIKTCLLAQTSFEADVNVVVTFILNEGVISIFLLYLLYSKTIGLETKQEDEQTLSLFYSQRDNKLINTKIMRRCLFFGITALLIHWIFIVSYVFFKFRYLHQLSILANNVSILVSFDLNLCKNNNDNQQIEMTEHERSEYFNKIMKAYYSTPIKKEFIVTHE